MKKLVIINGTMGSGKTAVCRELYKTLDKSVWLDGDWCWMMNPFVVNEENKRMVEDNITFLLRSFLNNSSFKYVIFNWVIHTEEIFDMILKGIQELEFELYKITLVCSPEALRMRITKDIQDRLRTEDNLNCALERLPRYQAMSTIKVDTSNISIVETANKIKEIIQA